MPDIVNVGLAANDGTGDGFRTAFEKINAQFALLSAAWQDYTPVWTAAGATQPTLGNGALFGRYIQLGKTVIVTVNLTIGSTTNVVGTSTWELSVPVTAAPGSNLVGAATILDAGTDNKLGATSAVTPDTVAIIGEGTNVVSGSLPITWADGDALRFTLTYEAA